MKHLLALLLAGACVPTLVDSPPDPEDPGPGSGGGGGGGGGTDDPSRLFAATSPWNVKATGSVDPASARLIASGELGSLAYSFAQTGRGLDIAGTDAFPDYGIPLYEATAATPTYRVADKYGWWPGFAAVPIPADATPAAGTDHHLSIWNRDDHTIWEFWEMERRPDGTWVAGAGVKFDTTGAGYSTTPWTLSARAYGGAAAAGLIRYDEMQRGVIAHALALAYPWTRGKLYAQGLGVDGKTANIASHSDNAEGVDRNRDSNIPEGARLRLKASVDVTAKCAGNRACTILGTALQQYGAYLVDTAGVATIVAEVLTGRGKSWTGVLAPSDVRSFAADDFELLSLPATLTATPP